jgi:invasion protein IalB
MTGSTRRRVMAAGLVGVLVGGLALGALPARAQTVDPSAPPRAAVDLPTPPDGRSFVEYDETFKGWKLYCQLWPATRRTECEISTRGANDRSARLLWLRSTERWLDGLRFRFEVGALEADKPVRIWTDKTVFRPEFPCKPFPFESNTCAVTDPEINRKLVEKLFTAQEVAAVGQTAVGTKAEIRFALTGFKAAVERTEQLRASLGAPWMTQGMTQGMAQPAPGGG